MSNPIVLENQKPGTPESIWKLSSPPSSNIEGFATDISTNINNVVDFKINTDSTDYRIDIYRLGYYDGDGARLAATIQHQNETPTASARPAERSYNGPCRCRQLECHGFG